ncbi:Rho termination factor N-terminal domain-containing protein, partial [uncultured Actinomyces sp.]|uniref:Rho termination factor N-terminal domain-containing protein n=1 Tax=uncultured Actinomyces sp. TaxID=249061 RepID=UPI0026099D7B
MTETSAALSTMRLAELQQLAGSMGLKGISRMRKSELVAAIRDNGSADGTAAGAPDQAPQSAQSAAEPTDEDAPAEQPGAVASTDAFPLDIPEPVERAAYQDRPRRRRAVAAAGTPHLTEREATPAEADLPRRDEEDAPTEGAERTEERRPRRPRLERGEGGRRRRRAGTDRPERGDQRFEGREDRFADTSEDHLDAKAALMRDLADATGTPAVEPAERSRGTFERENEGYDEDGRGRRRRGRKRGRERYEDEGPGRQDRDRGERGGRTSQREEEVLLPVAGILDASDPNHAYLRTSGYLPGPKDVYVTAAQVKDNGLRPGDAITGWVREGGETPHSHMGGQGRANRRQNRAGRVKYNPLVSVETVNGMDPERARRRPEFVKLTPLYPQEQLRLETTPKALTPRVIDLVSPIGKGQRGLIVSPPRVGKTIVLQQIANAIAINNPEAHLMVVLVDERPEE